MHTIRRRQALISILSNIHLVNTSLTPSKYDVVTTSELRRDVPGLVIFCCNIIGNAGAQSPSTVQTICPSKTSSRVSILSTNSPINEVYWTDLRFYWESLTTNATIGKVSAPALLLGRRQVVCHERCRAQRGRSEALAKRVFINTQVLQFAV